MVEVSGEVIWFAIEVSPVGVVLQAIFLKCRDLVLVALIMYLRSSGGGEVEGVTIVVLVPDGEEVGGTLPCCTVDVSIASPVGDKSTDGPLVVYPRVVVDRGLE